jgi:hypothetical protein
MPNREPRWSFIMRFVVIATVVLASCALPATGIAQGSPSSPPAATAPRPAPVGHKQPKAKDLPERRTDQALEDMDRAMDRALKGICRGC